MFTNMIESDPEGLKEVLDIIFKWAHVKLADSSNTKFAVSIFDFFTMVLEALESEAYSLWDFEAAVFFPLLCDKSGLNNAILKEKVKKLIR